MVLQVNEKDKDNKELHERIIEDNKLWIKQKQDEKEKDRPHPVDKKYEYVDGTAIYIMGKAYKLKVLYVLEGNELSEDVFMSENKLVVSYNKKNGEPHVRELIKDFIIRNNESYIKGKLDSYCIQLGIKDIKFELKEYKNKLGLCKKNKEVYFDWRILMFDTRLIDYVILHELVHIQEMNHKDGSWKKLESLMPDYALREKEIKVNRAILFNF